MLLHLTHGDESLLEIQEFISQNKNPDYSLSIFNILEQSTAEIICSDSEIFDAIIHISSIEHTFPEWIGINHLSDSYIVGMEFARGTIITPSVYEYKNGILTKKV